MCTDIRQGREFTVICWGLQAVMIMVSWAFDAGAKITAELAISCGTEIYYVEAV